MKRKALVLGLAGGLCLLLVLACAAKPAGETATAAIKMELQGSLALVGNEPLSWLVVRTDDGRQYRLPDSDATQYHDLQNRRVIITAQVSDQPLTLANGKRLANLWQITSIIELKVVP